MLNVIVLIKGLFFGGFGYSPVIKSRRGGGRIWCTGKWEEVVGWILNIKWGGASALLPISVDKMISKKT